MRMQGVPISVPQMRLLRLYSYISGVYRTGVGIPGISWCSGHHVEISRNLIHRYTCCTAKAVRSYSSVMTVVSLLCWPVYLLFFSCLCFVSALLLAHLQGSPRICVFRFCASSSVHLCTWLGGRKFCLLFYKSFLHQAGYRSTVRVRSVRRSVQRNRVCEFKNYDMHDIRSSMHRMHNNTGSMTVVVRRLA